MKILITGKSAQVAREFELALQYAKSTEYNKARRLKLLVTGAAVFIGMHMAKRQLERGDLEARFDDRYLVDSAAHQGRIFRTHLERLRILRICNIGQ